MNSDTPCYKYDISTYEVGYYLGGGGVLLREGIKKEVVLTQGIRNS